ncbi:MAG: ferritin-like domain-containing protein [Verrucomicrobia bacterium]|nr:ferritin-like domain-containing protein [Verrucomicrobiota bacterium]
MKPIKHVEIVDELNRLMAEELEAFLRYFQLRYRLRGVDKLAAENFFQKAMDETLEHAEAIAAHIRVLGETPKLNIKLEVGGGPVSLKEALNDALIFEQQALNAYKDMLPRVAGDPGLEDFIRKQIATETEHVQEIAMLLE